MNALREIIIDKNITNKNINKIENDEDIVCPICLDDIILTQTDIDYKIRTIRCGHHFHRKCIRKWKKHNTCPVCRSSINTKKPKRAFKYVPDVEEDEVTAMELQHLELFGDNDEGAYLIPRYIPLIPTLGETEDAYLPICCNNCFNEIDVDGGEIPRECPLCSCTFCSEDCVSSHNCD